MPPCSTSWRLMALRSSPPASRYPSLLLVQRLAQAAAAQAVSGSNHLLGHKLAAPAALHWGTLTSCCAHTCHCSGAPLHPFISVRASTPAADRCAAACRRQRARWPSGAASRACWRSWSPTCGSTACPAWWTMATPSLLRLRWLPWPSAPTRCSCMARLSTSTWCAAQLPACLPARSKLACVCLSPQLCQ